MSAINSLSLLFSVDLVNFDTINVNNFIGSVCRNMGLKHPLTRKELFSTHK